MKPEKTLFSRVFDSPLPPSVSLTLRVSIVVALLALMIWMEMSDPTLLLAILRIFGLR